MHFLCWVAQTTQIGCNKYALWPPFIMEIPLLGDKEKKQHHEAWLENSLKFYPRRIPILLQIITSHLRVTASANTSNSTQSRPVQTVWENWAAVKH